MDKKSGPKRTSSKSLSDTVSSEAKADSGPAGKGSSESEDGKLYRNERGQICYGDGCVSLTMDTERAEIVVNVKRDSTCNAEPLIEAMRDILGKKSRTVYEIENE